MKVTEVLLQIMYGVNDLMDCITISRSDLWNTINGSDYRKNWSRSRFNDTLHNLKKSGCVKLFKGSDSIEFTNKAKLRIIDFVAGKVESDSHFRFVSFDIPEDMRCQRDLFRRAIKKLGFKQVQKSLWVVNKNVGNLVELAAYEYGVEKYVIYIASNKSDIDGVLSKKFPSSNKVVTKKTI